MAQMRYVLLALLPLAVACESTKHSETELPDVEVIANAPELTEGETNEMVKATYTNVRHYQELRRQGQMQKMVALHRAIARTVDENFNAFKKLALDKKSFTPRNWSVACLGFSMENKTAARRTLEKLLDPSEHPWLLANACLSLAILADPDTDLSRVIPLIGHGDIEVRTSAASCIKEIWRVQETPRKLTPQHYAAIDRLVALLNDRATTRGRRAAAWALANLRHPETLDYLISALKDSDEMVQIGGLYGISLLGDARALDPLFEYLDEGPTTQASSWAKKALAAIAVQNGFANTPSELEELGTSGREWRKWFRAARMK